MKKFTKITLIIVGILAGLGILLGGISAAMGAGWATIHREALNGEFDFGNWHFGDGIYYSTSNTESGGKESTTESYAVSEVTTLELDLDTVSELILETSDTADTITVKMEAGYKKYFSAEQNGSTVKISYNTYRHSFRNDPVFTVTLPADSSSLCLDLDVGVGDVSADNANVTVKNLLASVGVGDIDLYGISVKENADFEIGTGDADISEGNYQKVSLKGGVGDLSFQGEVSEQIKAESGTGDIDIELSGREEDYAYDVTTGLGDVYLNGKSIGTFAVQYKTENSDGADVILTTGTGDIDIMTK